MVNPTTSPLIFSKLLYNIYLPLPIFLPPTNKNHLVIFLNPSPPELPFLRSLPYISLRKHRGSAHRARGLEYKQKQQSPIPPLSGGEVARKTEEKWARTVRTKRVPQTPTATAATNPKTR